jgi:EAL domain-containing protein (putative c-di-GMP-specific phosphodiesterase class I)
VVRQALRRLATGCRIPSLCINLSAQTLADSSFPAFVAEELLALGVEGDRILFEIEEADAIAVPDCLARFAATVGSLGAGIIIESFGRASDAWAPLKVPCLRYVKLHGSLTRQVLARQALTEEKGALLQTAYAMGIELIADFVEELHALRRLKTLNIGYVQGIGVYEPHPLDSFGEREAQQVA